MFHDKVASKFEVYRLKYSSGKNYSHWNKSAFLSTLQIDGANSFRWNIFISTSLKVLLFSYINREEDKVKSRFPADQGTLPFLKFCFILFDKSIFHLIFYMGRELTSNGVIQSSCCILWVHLNFLTKLQHLNSVFFHLNSRVLKYISIEKNLVS